MELSRYDGYWRGKPLLDKIVRREFKDPATALKEAATATNAKLQQYCPIAA